jgi:hypothetical protein
MKNLLNILILFFITTTLFSQSKQDIIKSSTDYSTHPQDNPDLIYPTISGNLRHQVLYFCLQPTDLGIGIRGDYRFTKNINKGNNVVDLRLTSFGIYSSLTYGNYKFLGGHINDHFKLSGGGIYYLPVIVDKFGDLWQSFFTGGLCYHHYGEFVNDFNVINPKVLKPMSFELGTGVNLSRVILGVRRDFLKGEVSFDLGYTF